MPGARARCGRARRRAPCSAWCRAWLCSAWCRAWPCWAWCPARPCRAPPCRWSCPGWSSSFRAAVPRRAPSSAVSWWCSTDRWGWPALPAGPMSIGPTLGFTSGLSGVRSFAPGAFGPNGLRPSIGPFCASVVPVQVIRAYEGRSAIRTSAGADRSAASASSTTTGCKNSMASPPLRNAPVVQAGLDRVVVHARTGRRAEGGLLLSAEMLAVLWSGRPPDAKLVELLRRLWCPGGRWTGQLGRGGDRGGRAARRPRRRTTERPAVDLVRGRRRVAG